MSKLCFVLPALALLAACAGTPVREPAPAPAEAAGRPFIERSLVLAPERAGKFTLVRLYDFEGRPDAGVGLRYQHDDVPEMILDVYVYPIGRVQRGRALALGMESTRADLALAVEQGAYSDIVYGEETAFDLRSVAEDGSAGPAGEPDPALGRRQSLRYVREEGPMDSLVFMFQRGLFLAKGRASAKPTQVPPETFNRLANHAMQVIVPAIIVRSTGGCAERVVEVDPRLEGEAFQAQLLEGLEQTLRQANEEGCDATLDPAVPPGMRGHLLEFPPAMWGQG